VAETIERRLREIEAQLDGYEELARERDRLRRALHELRSDDGARPGRASATPPAAGRASSRRRRGGRRARRGANVEAITGYVSAHPGATAAEIAAATGIDRGTVYSATSRLAATGRLRRISRGERQVGYQPGGDDGAGRAAVPEPQPPEARGAPDADGSRAGRGPGHDTTPRVPVDATRPAAKRSRTVAPSARRTPKRAATGARAPAGGQKRATDSARGKGGRRGASARGRAPRGANRTAVLEVIGERPGVSARELATASGVGGGTLYALLRTLAERGEIDKEQLPSGYAGYTLAATPATTDPSAAANTPRDGAHDTTPAAAAHPGTDDHDATPSATNRSARAQTPAGGPHHLTETK
jgi:DNA-binding MarR family transcriptional regulator